MNGALLGAAATALTVKSALAGPLAPVVTPPLDEAAKKLATAKEATISTSSAALGQAGEALQGAVVQVGTAGAVRPASPLSAAHQPAPSAAGKPGARAARPNDTGALRAERAEPSPGSVTPDDRPRLVQILRQAAARHGVDQRLVLAVSYWESGWDQSKVSATGAVGLMQVEPATAQEAGPSLLGRTVDINNPYDNADVGVAVLQEDLANFGSPAMALAAYYQGPASLKANGMLPDTQQYVEGILDLAKRLGP